MFFQSPQHQGCLQKLELAIRLKRGLSVVIGDIGTGKSTLCRQLIQRITHGDSPVLPYLILDPEFTTPLEFLTTIAKTFGLAGGGEGGSEWQLKDDIKNSLFEQAIERQRVPCLILDEGQKLPGFCVEILREFLNFETNCFKILQIVIFAQPEFRAILKQKANFADRITSYQTLRPLSLRDTRAMIAFRLKASHTEAGPVPRLFSLSAILAVFLLTRGYPRRIVMLCSKVIIQILVNQKRQAGALDVLRAARETARSKPSRLLTPLLLVALGGVAIVGLAGGGRLIRPPGTLLSRAVVASSPAPAVVAGGEPQSVPSGVGGLEREETRPAPSTTIMTTTTVSSVPTTSLAPSPATTTLPAAPPPLPSPTILGTLEVEPGVILSKMVARVYGRYTPQRLAMVLAANPGLSAPDAIRAKDSIRFPIPPEADFALPRQGVWLELATTASLTEAYVVLKAYPETAPPLLIKPTKGEGDRLLFHVLVEESFADELAANHRLKALPPEWQGRTRVVGP